LEAPAFAGRAVLVFNIEALVTFMIAEPRHRHASSGQQGSHAMAR
jgi:hypothetical protein